MARNAEVSAILHRTLSSLELPSSIVSGIDIVGLDRFRRHLAMAGDRFLQRLFRPSEIAQFGNRIESMAGFLAAKEAVTKALGTGLRGVGWHEIEIGRKSNGAPFVQLYGRAARRAEFLGLSGFSISITHDAGIAAAIVIAERIQNDGGNRECQRANR